MKLEEKKVSILSLKCTENNAPAASWVHFTVIFACNSLATREMIFLQYLFCPRTSVEVLNTSLLHSTSENIEERLLHIQQNCRRQKTSKIQKKTRIFSKTDKNEKTQDLFEKHPGDCENSGGLRNEPGQRWLPWAAGTSRHGDANVSSANVKIHYGFVNIPDY